MHSFKPDVLVDRPSELTIGGTRISLIPIVGGETPDGMFVELPDQGVLFVGDFIMPYLGAPFVEEGNLQGLLDAARKHQSYIAGETLALGVSYESIDGEDAEPVTIDERQLWIGVALA